MPNVLPTSKIQTLGALDLFIDANRLDFGFKHREANPKQRKLHIQAVVSNKVTGESKAFSLTNISFTHKDGITMEVREEKPDAIFGTVNKQLQRSDIVAEDFTKKLVDNCNSYEIYMSVLPQILKIFDKVTPIMAGIFENCEKRVFADNEKKEVDTFAVAPSKIRDGITFYANPQFLLRESFATYASDLEGDKVFSSFTEAYIYTACFILIHEMQHVLRSHSSNLKNGIMTTNHELANILEDAFININTAELLTGCGLGALGKSYVKPPMLVSGQDGNQVLVGNGFKKFHTIEHVVAGVVELITKHFGLASPKINIMYVGDSQKIPLIGFDGSQLMLYISCWDLSIFSLGNSDDTKINSIDFVNFYTLLINTMCNEDKVKSLYDELRERAPKNRKKEVELTEEQKQEIRDMRNKAREEIQKEKALRDASPNGILAGDYVQLPDGRKATVKSVSDTGELDLEVVYDKSKNLDKRAELAQKISDMMKGGEE